MLAMRVPTTRIEEKVTIAKVCERADTGKGRGVHRRGNGESRCKTRSILCGSKSTFRKCGAGRNCGGPVLEFIKVMGTPLIIDSPKNFIGYPGGPGRICTRVAPVEVGIAVTGVLSGDQSTGHNETRKTYEAEWVQGHLKTI